MGLKPCLYQLSLLRLEVIQPQVQACLGDGELLRSLGEENNEFPSRLRLSVRAWTFPVRVSKAANRCNAPHVYTHAPHEAVGRVEPGE